MVPNKLLYSAQVTVSGKIVSHGLFLIPDDMQANLVALVTNKAKQRKGIGEIHWQDYLAFKCDENGKQTDGCWKLKRRKQKRKAKGK